LNLVENVKPARTANLREILKRDSLDSWLAPVVEVFVTDETAAGTTQLGAAKAEQGSCGATRFGGVNPIFRVQNLDASVKYYVDALGFQLKWRVDGFADVSRDRVSIFLCEGDQGHFGTWVWIGVGNVEVLLKELQAKGARVRNPPQNYDWAYEMQIEDLDGNVLRIGSDTRKDKPAGKWRDMNGRVWEPRGDGRWECVQE
jgi:catechol 2,3-dioxygenase-like lactoylglutathione lyase family enzyme